MNRKTITIIGALVLVGALIGYYFWPKEPVRITNYPSQGTDIVAFGDSLVVGDGSDQGDDFVSLLSQDIGEPIINLGVDGETTAQGLARISALDAYHPKIVLLLLGGNDALQKVSIDETFQNLSEIIQNIQHRGAIVLLLGVQGGLLSDPYASRFQKLAQEYGTAYVSNVLSGLFGNPQYMSDEVHPNDAGYAIIAKRVEPVLQELLQ